jgi:hypothetical protein
VETDYRPVIWTRCSVFSVEAIGADTLTLT